MRGASGRTHACGRNAGGRAGPWFRRGHQLVSLFYVATMTFGEAGLTASSLGCPRGQALAGVACRRRQKKYESPQSTPVAAAQPHAFGPSPTARWAMSAEPRSMTKPA